MRDSNRETLTNHLNETAMIVQIHLLLTVMVKFDREYMIKHYPEYVIKYQGN